MHGISRCSSSLNLLCDSTLTQGDELPATGSNTSIKFTLVGGAFSAPVPCATRAILSPEGSGVHPDSMTGFLGGLYLPAFQTQVPLDWADHYCLAASSPDSGSNAKPCTGTGMRGGCSAACPASPICSSYLWALCVALPTLIPISPETESIDLGFLADGMAAGSLC